MRYFILQPSIHQHKCAPSPVQHLVREFSKRCYDEVAKNPTRAIGDIYKEIRCDMTSRMTSDEKKLFLEDISDIQSIRPQLYNHRRNFIPRAPEEYVRCQLLYSIFI